MPSNGRFYLPSVGGANQRDRLPGWHDDDSKLTKRRASRAPWTRRRALKVATAIAALILFLFWRWYEVHIEIQIYSKGWISKSIQPVLPLSSTCFNPDVVAKSSYPSTLASAPSVVQLHAGLAMRMGDDCYNFASTIPQKPTEDMQLPEHTIIHTYWRADLLPLGDRQIALLDSLLAMQDRQSTSVILWTNAPSTTSLEQHPRLAVLLKRYGRRLTVRSADKRQLALGTPMEEHRLLEMADSKAWLDGDLVRVLVLWALGGVWVDMDTIMTGRDLRVLLEHEWVTQWDCYDKPYAPLNGAMMHFYQNSPYLCEMLYAMAHDPAPKRGTTDWGSRLYHKVWRRLVANGHVPFQVLPYCFTDGQTCRLDNRLPDPFAQRDSTWGTGRAQALKTKLNNVWAVHLHNQWDKTFPNEGWVRSMILSKVDDAVTRYDESEADN